MLDTREDDAAPENIPQEIAVDFVDLTAEIVSAYVSHHAIPVGELAGLLTSVHAALSSIATIKSFAPPKEEIEKPTPAQIRKSITPDALISFEDGKRYKTLRRHLNLRGLSPETYRAKYGLPVDYPMIAANHSARRSELARAAGLGNHRKASQKAAEPDGTT